MNKRQWLEQLKATGRDRCMMPGCGAKTRLQTHHISKGPGRKDEPCTMVRLCLYCHSDIHNVVGFNVEHELAIKACGDPEHYDRRQVNELRGRAPEAIEEYEVIGAAAELHKLREKT